MRTWPDIVHRLERFALEGEALEITPSYNRIHKKLMEYLDDRYQDIEDSMMDVRYYKEVGLSSVLYNIVSICGTLRREVQSVGKRAKNLEALHDKADRVSWLSGNVHTKILNFYGSGIGTATPVMKEFDTLMDEYNVMVKMWRKAYRSLKTF